MSAAQDTNRTVWVGNLEPWMDQVYLKTALAPTGKIVNCKVICDRDTQIPKQYAFIEYSSHEEAKKLIEKYAGDLFVSKDNQRFKLGWALHSPNTQRVRDPCEVSLYVGNLDINVKEAELRHLFASRYASVTEAKVIIDPQTGLSRGFGFVRFSEVREAELALSLMQGVYCGGRPMRVKPSTKHSPDGQLSCNLRLSPEAAFGGFGPPVMPPPPTTPPPPLAAPPMLAPTGHLVYFSGLETSLTELHVLERFQSFGKIYRGTAYPNTGAGVVEFKDLESAEAAVKHLERIGAQAQRVDGNQAQPAAVQCCPPQYAFALPLAPAPYDPNQPPPPAITNMTMAQAQSELDRAAARDAPGIEHFQELLRDPCFVQAFERQLAQGEQACGGTGNGAGGLGATACAPAKMPWVLQDRPELFELPASVEQMNEDYLPSPGSPRACGRLFPSLTLAPLLPCEMGLA